MLHVPKSMRLSIEKLVSSLVGQVGNTISLFGRPFEFSRIKQEHTC